MRVLVTGANGFAGGYLLRELLSDTADELYAAVGPNGGYMRSPAETPALRTVELDLTDDSSVRAAIEYARPHRVYHLAGIAVTFGHAAEHYMRVNALGAHLLGQAVLEVMGGSCRMLYISSAAVYAGQTDRPIREQDLIRPKNEYGVSKYAGELLLGTLADRGLDVRIARPFNHTGPGQSYGFVSADIVKRLQNALAEGASVLSIGRLDAVRDFLDVRDVARAYRLIMECFEAGEVVNVASGRGVSVREIVTMLLMDVACRPDIRVEQDAGLTVRQEQDIVVGDASRLRERTGWTPAIPFAQTLADMWSGNVSDGGAPSNR